jgi:hypothetical protein
LGPILFLIYVNDIDSVCCVNTALQLFADDAKLYSQVEMNNSSVSLQQTLHLLSQWASDWQLTINVDKCLVLSISTKSVPDQPQYFINGVPVLHRNSSVDLGVTISHDLSFDSHVNIVVSRARQRLSVLFRGFSTRNLFIMRQAFITYIRPILEYNSVIWNPTSKFELLFSLNLQCETGNI